MSTTLVRQETTVEKVLKHKNKGEHFEIFKPEMNESMSPSWIRARSRNNHSMANRSSDLSRDLEKSWSGSDMSDEVTPPTSSNTGQGH